MENNNIRVLLIDDNPIDATVIQKMLSVAPGGPFPVEWVDRLSTGLGRISEQEFDVVLLDLSLPDSEGLDTFIKVRAKTPEMPIIVLSGLEGETIAVEALKAGAQDYLVKTWINKQLLARALRLALERKRAEQEMKSALQMKSDFVSFATHQLRTPLAGIKWLLELAAQEEEVPKETSSLIQDARDSAERLIGMVNDLLDVARLESGKLKLLARPTNLGELTDSVLKDIGHHIHQKAQQLAVSGADAIPAVWVDPHMFRQVILNLVSNAIKYTPPEGKIGIQMSQENGCVRWAIQDSGIGIPKSSQARLFEKFFRAENVYKVETEGTGLGLYLVRLIVERSGGKVRFESEEGKGSTFIFILPVEETDGSKWKTNPSR